MVCALVLSIPFIKAVAEVWDSKSCSKGNGSISQSVSSGFSSPIMVHGDDGDREGFGLTCRTASEQQAVTLAMEEYSGDDIVARILTSRVGWMDSMNSEY